MNSVRALALCLVLTTATATLAGDSACPECGCGNRRVTCRLVCKDKEIKETRWKCECEDFCVPGPSHPCGEDCECDPTKKSGFWCIKLWQPGCAKVRTRKVLVKDEVKRTVPSHEWVVEELCEGCGCCLDQRAAPAKAASTFDYEAGVAGVAQQPSTYSSQPARSNSRRTPSKGQE